MSNDPDIMMLELFRAEVESHSESLTNSLLKLEQQPEATDVLDGMMRAAHSIKGAARIVRVDAAVEVAHVMEDCFVAAQRGELVLEPSAIDIMLRGVDLLVRISDASKEAHVDWSEFDSPIQSTVEQLRCVLNRQPIDTQARDASPKSKEVTDIVINEAVSIANTIQLPAKSTSESAPPVSTATRPIAMHSTVARSAPLASKTPTSQSATSQQSFLFPKSIDEKLAEELRLQVIQAIANSSDVVIDLHHVTDLSALGLAWLHSAYQYAASKSSKMSLIQASPSISKILQCFGLKSQDA